MNSNVLTSAKEYTHMSGGPFFNTGHGPNFQTLDIGHHSYMALIEPDTAYWALVPRANLGDFLSDSGQIKKYQKKAETYAHEMRNLRFGLTPSAVYFNPTDLCNLNCSYCYIPESLRKDGTNMSKGKMKKAFEILKVYFKGHMPLDRKPQIVFHGAEPMINRDVVFPLIEEYKDDFEFGIQTNGTLLDEEAIVFLIENQVGIGLSLDGHLDSIASLTRKTWGGSSVFKSVLGVMNRLRGYHGYNVICTATRENMKSLKKIIGFFHDCEVPACMLNPVRCTREGAREIRPKDHELAKYYLAALDYSQELYQETGRKIVVVNFANVLIGMIAPTARRLMCDISPCGGGRCFFAVSAKGDVFPCSEFIGVNEFRGGNLFKDRLKDILVSDPFEAVKGRKVEDIEPCGRCAVRHFCGSPCPAEAVEMNGGMDRPGAFCELYEEQARYAFRIIADRKVDDYLWDGWDKGLVNS